MPKFNMEWEIAMTFPYKEFPKCKDSYVPVSYIRKLINYGNCGYGLNSLVDRLATLSTFNVF